MRAIFRLMWAGIWAGWFAVGGFIWMGLTGMRDTSVPSPQPVVEAQSYVGVDGYVYAVAAVQHPEAETDPPGLLTVVMASAVGRIETALGGISRQGNATATRLHDAPDSSSHHAAVRLPVISRDAV